SELSGGDSGKAEVPAWLVLTITTLHMNCHMVLFALVALFPSEGLAQEPLPADASPAFTNVPELVAGFNLLYETKFSEARAAFEGWEANHQQEPFGEVAVAASYLFEELY